jgi:hypothetical protein
MSIRNCYPLPNIVVYLFLTHAIVWIILSLGVAELVNLIFIFIYIYLYLFILTDFVADLLLFGLFTTSVYGHSHAFINSVTITCMCSLRIK